MIKCKKSFNPTIIYAIKNTSLRDITGKNGDKVGDEFDITARFPISQYIFTFIGYSHFWGGDFTKRATQIISNAGTF